MSTTEPSPKPAAAAEPKPAEPKPPLPPMLPPGPLGSGSTQEWLRIELVRPLTAPLLIAAVGVGLLGDLAVRSGVTGVAGALLVLATSGVLLASGRLRTRQSKILVGLAPVFGLWLALRSSPWLLPLDVIAAAGLLALGVSLSSGGSVMNLPLAGLFARAWHAGLQSIAVPESVVRLIARRDRQPSVTWAVVRGMLLAAPVVLLLGVLLVSADAVFASMVSIDLSGAVAFEHVFVVGFVTWCAIALLRVASAHEPPHVERMRPKLGAVEALVVLGSVIVLFGGFAVAQAIAVIGGEQYVRETTGVTYAEYARSGFFQLLWVAALTVGGLLLLRTVTKRTEQRRFTVLSCVVAGLTLLIVTVAIRRLTLYSEAYGLTMLRLYCVIFAVWIAAVLVLLGLWLAGVKADRTWFPAAASALGLALLLGLNVANPEAYVARTNLQRADTPLEVDTGYLTSNLSDDAVPTIAGLLPDLDADAREDALRGLCDPTEHGYTGWAAWNASAAAAADRRAELC